MKNQTLFLCLIFLIICPRSFSQNFLITEPKLEFDTLNLKLSISYDLINKDQTDIFFMWVEIRNKNGVLIKANSFKGDVGDSIKPGNDKKIYWIPEDDAVYIDEDVTVELSGEKYIRTFNKGSMIALSAVVPGLGQSKMNKGKPWWLLGIPAYGALAGGFIVHGAYQDSYNAYLNSTDQIERTDFLNKSQKQKNLSGALFISAATLWGANIIWVAATPNRYRPLQHTKLSINSVPFNQNRVTLLSVRVDF
jgi:hypothetical protein